MMCRDKVSLTCNVKTWHEILGHCNMGDGLKLASVVEGMKITGNTKIDCVTCNLHTGRILITAETGKLTQERMQPLN